MAHTKIPKRSKRDVLIYAPSLLHEGDITGFRIHQYTRTSTVDLARVKIPSHCQLKKDSRVGSKRALQGIDRYVLVPELLDPLNGKSERVRCLTTGGRTVIPQNSPVVTVELQELGWSDTSLQQQFVLEYKGAGTNVHDAHVNIHQVREKTTDGLFKAYLDHLMEQSEVLLGVSAHCDHFSGPWGATTSKSARYSLQASNSMSKKRFPFKHTSDLIASQFPQAVVQRIAQLNLGLEGDDPTLRYRGRSYAQQVRMVPSSVRAIHIDKARTDAELALLVSRIHPSADELEKTVDTLVKDARTWMDLVTQRTCKKHDASYRWTIPMSLDLAWRVATSKDWNESEVSRYKNDHPFAWYLAKDLVLSPTGAWFVDFEYVYDGVEHANSSTKEDLYRKQELYMLCVIRDFQRVITQVEVGRQLLQGRHLSRDGRRQIQNTVLERLTASMNTNPYLSAQFNDTGIQIAWSFEKLSNVEFSASFSTQQLSLRY